MRRPWLLLTASLALFACDDGSPTLKTHVPSDTQVQNLTPAQAQNVCEGFQNLANQLAGPNVQEQIACTIGGIAVQQLGQGSCTGYYSNCLKSGSNTGTTIDLMCQNATSAELPGCTATIGQLEACVNAIVPSIQTAIDSINCSLADDPNYLTTIAQKLDDVTSPTTLAPCQDLPAGCLDLLDLGAAMP